MGGRGIPLDQQMTFIFSVRCQSENGGNDKGDLGWLALVEGLECVQNVRRKEKRCRIRNIRLSELTFQIVACKMV